MTPYATAIAERLSMDDVTGEGNRVEDRGEIGVRVPSPILAWSSRPRSTATGDRLAVSVVDSIAP